MEREESWSRGVHSHAFMFQSNKYMLQCGYKYIKLVISEERKENIDSILTVRVNISAISAHEIQPCRSIGALSFCKSVVSPCIC